MRLPNTVRARDEIRRSIIEGRARPGERLVEARLADELGLSRTPVREALRLLASEGLVRFEPNRGASVRSLTVADIADVYELRARLEAMAGELAARRATPEQAVQLAEAHDAFAEAVAGFTSPTLDAVRGLSQANAHFHLAMIDAAHHRQLLDAIVRAVDHALLFQAFRCSGEDDLARSVQFHGLVVAAIRGGEGDRAGRLVHEHVLQGRDRLLAAIGERGSFEALFVDIVGDGDVAREVCNPMPGEAVRPSM